MVTTMKNLNKTMKKIIATSSSVISKSKLRNDKLAINQSTIS